MQRASEVTAAGYPATLPSFEDEILGLRADRAAAEERNPLAPVRNAAHILQRQDAETPVSQRARDIIARQVTVMARLIDDLMDLSRITQGRIALQRERVELATVIELAIEGSRPHIEEFGHALTVVLPGEPVVLDADVTRLSQVFVNLLANAAKYTDRGGRIELAACCDGDEVRVTVTDNGIGIPAEKLRSVFVMFSQVEGAISRSRGGLGIGLTLVKHLIELHGGSVEAQSAGLGGGSAFVVSLPVARQPADRPTGAGVAALAGTASPVVAAAADPLRILVVDDNRDGAETLSELLAELGHEVRMVHDGEAALREARVFLPQVMLLDIGLPMLDGYEVCRRLRAEPWGARIGVIAMTGWGDADAKRKGEAVGFDRHLTKPVEESLLLSALASLRVAS